MRGHVLPTVSKRYCATNEDPEKIIGKAHPGPDGSPDRTLIKTGEIWENPVNRERLKTLE